MKEIQTKFGKILCIKVPESASNDLIHYYNLELVGSELIYINKVLGKLSELTDKDCEEFVEFCNKQRIYRNYVGLLDQAWDCSNSAKESFISLLQSEDINTKKEHLIIKIL